MNRNVSATILIILAIGIYFTVTSGMLAEANAVRSVNNQYQAAIASAQELITVRDKVLNDYTNISEVNRNRLERMLPQGMDNIRLVIDLSNIATQHGLSLTGIKAASQSATNGPGAPAAPASRDASAAAPSTNATAAGYSVPVPTIQKVTVTFGVSAPYQQFISLLQDLESSLRIMDVTHLSVTVNDDGIYDWSVELTTYWLKSQ